VRVAPVRFVRPYYAFRPHLSLGFGLWVGFPFAYYDSYYYPSYYPYAYPYPPPAYGYPYPAASYPAYPASPYPASGYPSASYPSSQPNYPAAAGTVGVQADVDQANTGGVSFEITPSTAQIIVDGSYVGTVGEFGASMQPLGLPAGRHRIEIRATGYQTMSIDADIVAGQVIPYQGAMQR